jgi:hypothetical protein
MQSNPITYSLDEERRIIMKRIEIKNLILHFYESLNKRESKCRKIRSRLFSNLDKYISSDSTWLCNHIMECPVCQHRLAAYGKVHLALSFIKAQSHEVDLLMRANTQAINVLRHSLREAQEAQTLKQALPEPKLKEKMSKYLQPALNFAACILIMLLMKIGIFSSMGKFQQQGQKALEQYYINQVGEDIAKDIFPT